MATGENGGNDNAAKTLRTIFAAVGVAALAGLAIIHIDRAEASKQEQQAKLISDFAAANAIKLPPEIYLVPPGVYRIPAEMPDGEIEICKASVSQDATHAGTRHIVLSDCKPE